DPPGGAGDDARRVRRLGADAGQGRRERQLRVVRRRDAVSLPRRDAEPGDRAEDGPRPVQGLDAGAPGRDGRHRSALLRHHRRRAHHAADRARQGAGDERHAAFATDADGPDLRRARPQGRRRDRLVLVLRAGANASGDRRAAAQRIPEGGELARGAPATDPERHVPGRRRTRCAAQDDARRHRALGPHHARDELSRQRMKRPNFVFIVADDLGFADLGCYGGRVPVSPVLDRMAAEGIRFTHGYANSPVCSPTRFALMTGRYQYRLRGAAEEPISSRTRSSRTLGLPPEHPTLPSLLKAAGYRTALAGKWHLGYPPAFSPLRSGYDEFFGPMSGGVDYFSHCDNRGAHDLWQGEV